MKSRSDETKIAASNAPSHANFTISVTMAVSTPFSTMRVIGLPQCGQLSMDLWHVGQVGADCALRSFVDQRPPCRSGCLRNQPGGYFLPIGAIGGCDNVIDAELKIPKINEDVCFHAISPA